MDNSYQRTVSSDDGRGFKYENKMTAFAALRLYSNSDEFYLANNLDSGEKFDDLVFTYKSQNRWNTHFVQLKHKQVDSLLKKKISIGMLRSKGADYVIPKYFESYKKIFNKFNLQSSDLIFQRNYIGARFIMFTNAYLHEEILKRQPSTVDCSILSTNQENELNVIFDVTRDADILEKLTNDPRIRDFIGKFYFCSGQASEHEMDQLIQNEIGKILANIQNDSNTWSDDDIKYISMQFCAALYAWYTKGKYLTKDDVKNLLMDFSVASQCGKKSATTLKYTPKFSKLIMDTLKQDKIVSLESKAENSIMCMALLKQLGVTDEPNKVMDLNQLQSEQFQNHLLQMTVKDNTTLVIDCDADTLGIKKKELIVFFKRLFDEKPTLSVIFVFVVVNAAAIALIAELKVKRRKFNCTLMHLTEESKNKIMNSEMIFQGYPTSLVMLLASPNKRTFDDVINMAAMTQLLMGRLVEIGVRPIEQIPYYVPRVLTRFVTLNSTVLNNKNAKFLLSGISFENAISSLRHGAINIAISTDDNCWDKQIVILETEDDGEFFKKLSEKTTCPLHWLAKTKKSGNLWCWKKSTQNLHDLVGHINRTNRFCDYIPTENILEVKDKIVVIIAEPGMGKSTLLVHLASVTKKQNPEMWIITLALNDYTAQFDNPKFFDNVKQSTKDLIAFAAGVTDTETSKLNQRLFNQCYDVSGNMIILLDGFDEITPYYTEHGLAILNALKETAVSRVWVTARPILYEMLENATMCFSHAIKSFETKDQKNFLKKFWTHQLPNIDDEKLKIYIDKILSSVANSFDEKLDQFTGIPLQTRMLAEVFQPGLKTYHEKDELILQDRIDGVELFEGFVNIKRGIQMEKAKITVNNAIARYEQKILNDTREQELMRLALLTLLPRKTCATLDPPISNDDIQHLKEMVQLGNEKSGIVVSFTGETPQFIHRTFAEYFVALFFTKKFKSNKTFLNSDTFMSKNFEFVKYFFDRILAKGKKLHSAVLGKDYTEIEHMIENGADVDERDGAGRTALHVAAGIAGSETVIRILLQCGANVELVDDIFELSPLEHAIKYGDLGNIAAIYENNQKTSMAINVPITWQSLLIAVRGDYLQIFLHLLNNGIYGVETLDELSPQKWLNTDEVIEKMTILHLAAAYNAVKILNYLLRKDSRDSKLRLLDVVDGHNRTPLTFAAECGSSDAVDCFIKAGSKSLLMGSGKGLLEMAVEQRDIKLLEMALEEATTRNESSSEQHFAAAVTKLIADKSEWCALALDCLITMCPALVNFSTPKGVPLLAFAAIKNNAFAVQRLCELGADVDSGYPLHAAVSKGNDSVVTELLKCPRVDINAVNADGFTSLYLAARYNFAETFQLLVDANADIHHVANDGSDLTHAIGHSCNEAIFFFLLENNFDFKKANQMGESGLSLLKDKGAISLVRLLDPDAVIIEPQEEKTAVLETQQPKKGKKKKKQGVPVTGDAKNCLKNFVKEVGGDLKNLSLDTGNTKPPALMDQQPFIYPKANTVDVWRNKPLQQNARPAQQQHVPRFQQPVQQNFDPRFQQPVQQNYDPRFQQPVQQNFDLRFQQPFQQQFGPHYPQPVQPNFDPRFQQPVQPNFDPRFQQPVQQQFGPRSPQPVQPNFDPRFQQPAQQQFSPRFQQPAQQQFGPGIFPPRPSLQFNPDLIAKAQKKIQMMEQNSRQQPKQNEGGPKGPNPNSQQKKPKNKGKKGQNPNSPQQQPKQNNEKKGPNPNPPQQKPKQKNKGPAGQNPNPPQQSQKKKKNSNTQEPQCSI